MRANLVLSTSNTMTDRGAVAKSFASKYFPKVRLRELLRCEAFPEKVKEEFGMSKGNFRRFSEREQLDVLITRNFYCNDHFIHTLTTDVMAGLSLCERSRWKGPRAPASSGSELDEEEMQFGS
jgi:hypothetical protein